MEKRKPRKLNLHLLAILAYDFALKKKLECKKRSVAQVARTAVTNGVLENKIDSYVTVRSSVLPELCTVE